MSEVSEEDDEKLTNIAPPAVAVFLIKESLEFLIRTMYDASNMVIPLPVLLIKLTSPSMVAVLLTSNKADPLFLRNCDFPLMIRLTELRVATDFTLDDAKRLSVTLNDNASLSSMLTSSITMVTPGRTPEKASLKAPNAAVDGALFLRKRHNFIMILF